MSLLDTDILATAGRSLLQAVVPERAGERARRRQRDFPQRCVSPCLEVDDQGQLFTRECPFVLASASSLC